ncbi:MAG: hypothetical protein RL217_143 [Pseudomonadota bacterium]|jgi:thiamine biosynthesis protein ThiI
MKFVIKLFPEITVKSDSVRKNMTKILGQNLRTIFRRHEISADVQNRWDNLVVIFNKSDEKTRLDAISILSHTPGIAYALEVAEFPFQTLDEAYQHVRDTYRERLAGKSFCVRLKRAGNHDFTSNQAEAYMGGGLLKETQARKVDLHHPEVTVLAELRNDKVQVVKQSVKGLGGYPLGSQGEVLSLISGGFDSTVASYLMTRRGLKTHFCFFNLGGSAHEIGVKQVANYLWEKYSESHRVKFITVPFEGVVAEILKNVDTPQMGVVLKRMMLRAACAIAENNHISALVTGEAVAQVASQTITNLNVIDEVADRMVLRPLAAMDKQDIINIARRIGTETFAAKMPEYCGVISVNPTVVGDREKVAIAESKFDFSVLEAAIYNTKYERIDDVLKGEDSGLENLELVKTPAPSDIIIDIRHPDEAHDAPLVLPSNTIVALPFYELEQKIVQLLKQHDSARFLLYCQKGTMSKIHAHHLNQEHAGRFAVLVG